MELTSAHWVYLVGVLAIIAVMVARKNVVLPAVLATFITAVVFSKSVVQGVVSVFSASLVAASELFSIFLIIAVMVGLLSALRAVGADQRLVQPFVRVMRNGHIALVVLVIATYCLSLFFWPTPVVPLIGALLIPAAIRAGLPAIGAGAAVAIAGQGMALSADYVIRFQPGLSAKASGASMEEIANRGLVLSIVTGVVALILVYIPLRRHIQDPDPALLESWERSGMDSGALGEPPVTGKLAIEEERLVDINQSSDATLGPSHEAHKSGAALETVDSDAVLEGSGGLATVANLVVKSRMFAILVPIVFAVVVTYMLLGQFTSLVPEMIGGEAAALVGGTGLLLLLVVSAVTEPSNCLESFGDYITEGLVFAFKVMGVVLPIAGFFFMGNSELAGRILGLEPDAPAPGFFMDLIAEIENVIPANGFFVAFGVLLIGLLTGLDGSGSSGLPLTGALSGALGPNVGMDESTLAAIGQMGALWSGGGVLVAWSSLLAVAAFARVPVLDLARKCFLPVMAGLCVSTALAVVIF